MPQVKNAVLYKDDEAVGFVNEDDGSVYVDLEDKSITVRDDRDKVVQWLNLARYDRTEFEYWED